MCKEFIKINDEGVTPMVYSSADIFVSPSLEDDLPSTMFESLCCSTIALGFPTS